MESVRFMGSAIYMLEVIIYHFNQVRIMIQSILHCDWDFIRWRAVAMQVQLTSLLYPQFVSSNKIKTKNMRMKKQ